MKHLEVGMVFVEKHANFANLNRVWFLLKIENSPYRTGEYMIKFLIADAISFIKLVQFETKFPYLTQDLKFVGLKLC
jgi:hypothetical protein